MKQRRRYNPNVGQANIFNEIEGLDKLVNKPNIAEAEGFSVVHVVVSEKDAETPGYTKMALKLARQMLPEVKSTGRPPWLDPEWQAARRKRASR